jgi:hypothetical protein
METPAACAARAPRRIVADQHDRRLATPPAPTALRTFRSAQDQFIEHIRARIRELNLTLDDVDFGAGLPDRYLTKLLNPKTSGRRARWSTWDNVIRFLWPDGFELIIKDTSHDRRGRP